MPKIIIIVIVVIIMSVYKSPEYAIAKIKNFLLLFFFLLINLYNSISLSHYFKLSSQSNPSKFILFRS